MNQLEFFAIFVIFYLRKIEKTGLKRKDAWKTVICIPVAIFFPAMTFAFWNDSKSLHLNRRAYVLTYLTGKKPQSKVYSFHDVSENIKNLNVCGKLSINWL